MVTKELVIEGIRPPPPNVLFTTVSTTVPTSAISCPPLQVIILRILSFTSCVPAVCY